MSDCKIFKQAADQSIFSVFFYCKVRRLYFWTVFTEISGWFLSWEALSVSSCLYLVVSVTSQIQLTSFNSVLENEIAL